jgi:hypothetical protein
VLVGGVDEWESQRNVIVHEQCCFVHHRRNAYDPGHGQLVSYSGRKITPSLGYVTVTGEGKGKGEKTAESFSKHVFPVTKTFLSF